MTDAASGAGARFWTRVAGRSAAVLVCGACGRPSARDNEVADVRRLLGADFEGARIVATREDRLVCVDVRTLGVRDLGEFSGGGRSEGLSRPRLSPDGTRIVFSHLGKCYVMGAEGGTPRRVLEDQPAVHAPDWWLDPKTGELCIVFMNANGKHWYREDAESPGATFLWRMNRGVVTRIADFPCDGGLSLDGTHLGEAYGGCLVVDVPNRKYYRVQKGQACNGTMSPDNTYRLMYLYLPHQYFGARNKYGKESFRIASPAGSEEWETPRWSNHPDFCMATAKYRDYVPVLVRISTGETVVLHSLGGGWRSPHLWLPSAARGGAAGGPLAALDLKRLGRYRERVAATNCYTGILAELAAMADPEAAAIRDSLVEHARRVVEGARASDSVLDAAAMYREVADLYAGHRLGREAQSALDSDDFRTDVAASETIEELLVLEERLVAVKGSKPVFGDGAYFARNQAALVRMVGLTARLRDEFGSTRAVAAAERVSARYGLPRVTAREGNVKVVVDAVLEAASTVPSARQIRPYTAALTTLRYRVEKVIAGQYVAAKIMVVHWGMTNAVHTDAARWSPGLRQRLTADLFDAHPELADLTVARDAYDDLGLPEFYALRVEERP